MKKTAKTLTKGEEELMQVLWRLETAFTKDVLDALPEPKPHYNTVATLLNILVEKGFARVEAVGKQNRYAPLVKKDAYSRRTMHGFVTNYFNGSFADMLSFFAREKEISPEELEALAKELKSGTSPKS